MRPLSLAALGASLLGLGSFAAPLPAQEAPGGWDFSGVLDSTATGFLVGDGGGNEGDRGYGLEQYANLRLKAPLGERGTVYAAVNLLALAGRSAAAAGTGTGTGTESESTGGQRYTADLALERLYYRIDGKSFDTQVGLQRIAFGYTLAWSPTDFLSPANPLLPDARPRGVLGVSLQAYPSDTAKLSAFAVAGEDSTASDGRGATVGASGELHGRRASLQTLYAYQAPSPGVAAGVHRAGVSVKVEAGAGIVLEALYTSEGAEPAGIEGLQASAGADYSVLDGDLYLLGQYLYNGARGPNTADRSGDSGGKNYLYGSLSYRLDDYTTITASCAASLDDPSWSPYVEVSHEPFQGLTLSLSGRLPLGAGELGPERTGILAEVAAVAKLRF